MSERTCICGTTFTINPREGNKRKWCSEACRVRCHRAARPAPPKMCAVCEHPITGRPRTFKYCSDECLAESKLRRRRPPAHEPRPCKGCGTTITPGPRERNRKLWCSAACHARYQRRNASEQRRQAERERNRGRVRRSKAMPPRIVEARRKLRRASRGTSSKNSTWAMGHCDSCGESFTRRANGSIPRFCSEKCKRRSNNERRRARERDAYVEDVNRTAIFERDGWRCQLCRKKVDGSLPTGHMMSATLDHIVPLASGGLHEAANCQLAHSICNSLKGDRPWNEQLRLVG